MEKLKLILKGFVIGIANIIPGVSGGTLALLLGIYEKLLDVINPIPKSKIKPKFFLNFVKIVLITSKSFS